MSTDVDAALAAALDPALLAVAQGVAQLGAAAVDPGPDGAELETQDVGDLLVGEDFLLGQPRQAFERHDLEITAGRIRRRGNVNADIVDADVVETELLLSDLESLEKRVPAAYTIASIARSRCSRVTSGPICAVGSEPGPTAAW